MTGAFVVQVWSGKAWRKRRDLDPVRWGHVVRWERDDAGREVEVRRTRAQALARAERLAAAYEGAPRRESCSDGKPHRVVEVAS